MPFPADIWRNSTRMTSPTLTDPGIVSSTGTWPVSNRLANVVGARKAAAEDRLRLTPCHSNRAAGVLDLPPGRYTIGSASSSDVVLDTEGVAAQHCTILVGPRQTILKAWSPLTWINDGAVREGVLRTGDRLIIGPVEFTVERIQPPEPSPPDRRVSTLHRKVAPPHRLPPERNQAPEVRPGAEVSDRQCDSAVPRDAMPAGPTPKRSPDPDGRNQDVSPVKPRCDARPPLDRLPLVEERRISQEFVEAERRLERREGLLRELFDDVQGLLDECLQRERDGNAKLNRQRSELEERKVALDQLAEDLLMQQQQVHAESLRIENRSRELDDREELLRELESRERQLTLRQVTLDEWQVELERNQADLDRERDHLSTTQTELDRRARSIDLQLEELQKNRERQVVQQREFER